MFCLFPGLIFSKTRFLKPSPTKYKFGDNVSLYAGSLRSPTSLIHYEYYYADLFPQAKPYDELTTSLDPLLGRSFQKVPFQFKFGENERCMNFSRSPIDQSKYSIYYYLIYNNYEKSLIIDNIPFLTRSSKNYSVPNFKIGYIGVIDTKNFTSDKEVHLINHLDFTIFYAKSTNVTYHITKAFLKPYIIDPCSKGNPLPLSQQKEDLITYSIEWLYEETPEKNRYSHVYQSARTVSSYKPPHYTFLGLFFFAVFFPFLFGFIIKHDVDFFKHDFAENDSDPAGWQVIAGDVFRIPEEISKYSLLIAPGIRFGIDFILLFLLMMTNIVTLANTDLLWLILFIIDLISSFISGFVSGFHYKQFNGKDGDTFQIFVSTIPAIIIFVILFVVQFVHIAEFSTSAMPIPIFLFAAIFIILISAGSTYLGSMICGKLPKFDYPTRTNLIPRQIPESKIKLFVVLIGGLAIFASIYSFLPSMKSALFCDFALFRMIPDLAEMAFIVISFSSILTVLGVYIILREEDYWWWRYAIALPLSSGIFYFAWELFFMAARMTATNFATRMLYTLFAIICAILISVISAAFGFISSFFAILYMYRQI